MKRPRYLGSNRTIGQWDSPPKARGAGGRRGEGRDLGLEAGDLGAPPLLSLETLPPQGGGDGPL